MGDPRTIMYYMTAADATDEYADLWFAGEGFYFPTEDQSLYGPYKTYGEAQHHFERYCETL